MNWGQLIKTFKANNVYLCTGLFTEVIVQRMAEIFEKLR